jgi:tetratricopeptide (TPR) repeat protein
MARNRLSRVRVAPIAHPVATSSLPPLLRDPWALVVALAVLPVLFAARATPMGEPFSDDFLFLDFSLLHGNPSWWDGGGGVAYWRPLARQAYYGLFGPLMVSHPAVLAALHALALAAAGVLLLRALRRAWPAPAAAAAATFPLLMESTRTLLAWPSGAQDLGALLLLALALHAAARGRVALLAVAGVAAALCKEVAAPLALLAALAPFPRTAPTRWRAPLVTGATLAAWAALRFALPHFGAAAGITTLASPLAVATPFTSRLAHAIVLAMRDAFSLDHAPAWAAGAATAVALLPLLAALATRRTAGGDAWRWSAWGAAWFVAGAAPLALFLPDWASFRSVLPATGLGVALIAPLVLAPATWLLPLAAARLVALLLAPQPPARLQPDTSDAGDALSFSRLAQMQRAVHGVRGTLHALAPTLAPRSGVMKNGWPRMTGVAFAGDRSLRVWYRDTTLRWVTQAALGGPQAGHPVAIVEFEPHRLPQFAAVNRAAVEEVTVAMGLMRANRWQDALGLLDRTEHLLSDTTAACFIANLAGWRATCLLELGRIDAAEEQARVAISHYDGTPNGCYVLAEARMARGDWKTAIDLLDRVIALDPSDEDAVRLLTEAERRASLAGPPGGGAPGR